MKNRYGLSKRVLALLSTWSLLCGSAWAEHVDPAPLPDAVVKSIVLRTPDQDRMVVVSRLLERHVDEAHQIVRELEATEQLPGNVKQGAWQDKKTLVVAKQNELATLRMDTLAEMAAIRDRLSAAGLQQAAAQWTDKRSQVEQRFAEFDKHLAAVAKGSQARRGADLASLKAHVEGLQNDARARETPALLPISTGRQDIPLESVPQPVSKEMPRYMADAGRASGRSLAILESGRANLAAAPVIPADATSCGYADADLAATPEVQLTPEITGLAAQLGYSPARIYQYVYNNIRFEPYYGSLKGSQGTYLAQAGGSTDQASLLIALLRASNIPARYIKGTIQINDSPALGQNGRAPLWLGAKSYAAAAGILGQGRFPSVGVVSSSGVQLVQVWVEACVPYADYRGTQIDSTGYRWIPLDASFKDKSYQAGIATSTAFDYSGYMANRLLGGRTLLPLERYEQQIDSAIKSLAPNYGNNTLKDVGYTGTIRPRGVDVLPTTLPYKVISLNTWDTGLTAETATLPAVHRYKLNVTVGNSAGGALLTTSYAMPQIALQRLTLGFKGISPTVQATIDTWKNDGNMSNAVPCSLSVVPELKLDGVSQASGVTGVDYCSINNQLTLEVALPELGSSATINKIMYGNISAANLHALQAYAFQASDKLLASRAARLLNTVSTTPNPNSNQDETEGEFLHVVGLKYMRYFNDGAKRLGELDGMSGESGNHLGLTSSQAKVKYLFDIPFGVYRTGFLVDVPGGLSRSVSLVTGASNYDHFKLGIYNASSAESYVWLENAKLDAVSTVRGMQFAAEQGIQILTLNSTNWAANVGLLTTNANSALNYSATQVNSIKTNYIDKGYTLTIPRSLIQYNSWKGAVYMAEFNSALPWRIGAAINQYAGGYTTGAMTNSVDDQGHAITASTAPGSGYNWSLSAANSVNVSSIGGGTIGNGYSASDSSSDGVTSNSQSNPALNKACNNSICGLKVNMITGNEYHAETDFSIKGRGVSFNFRRHYNSRQPPSGWQVAPLGYGWTHTFNHYLTFQDASFDGSYVANDHDGITSSVIWTDGSGGDKNIQIAGTSAAGVPVGAAFTPPKAFYITVAKQGDGTYTITEKNGTIYTFQAVAGTVNQVARLTSIKDRNNNVLTLTYSGNKLLSVTDGLAANRKIDFTYDASNRISQIKDWSGRTFQYQYDAQGNLAAALNPLAVAGSQPPTKYAYYSGGVTDHAMKSYTLPRGNVMTFEYYANGKVFREYNSLGETNTFTYNELRRESSFVNARGDTRRFFFNADGNPVQVNEENGGVRTFTYDTTNPYLKQSETDPLGYVTIYAYDANGNLTQQTLPSLATLVYSNYNAFGAPGKIKDARGNYTILKYDVRGNLLESIALRSGIGAAVTDPQNYTPAAADVIARRINTYDANGNLLTAKKVRDFATSAGPTLTYGYTDAVNGVNGLNATSIVRTGDRDGIVGTTETDNATLTYDTLGRPLTAIRDNWYDTSYQYDLLGRVTQYKDGAGKLRGNSYDPNGNLIKSWLANGAIADVRTYSYDLADRTETAVTNGGGVTAFQYDAADNVVKVTNPDSYTLGIDYDANSYPIRVVDQKGNKVDSMLDLAGKPRSITDPNGNTVTRSYYDSTKNGWLKSSTDAAGRTTTLDYDAAGNVTSVTDNLGRVTLTTYDELNRPVRVVGPVLAAGNVRPVKAFTYTPLGHVASVKAGQTDAGGTNPAADTVAWQMAYAYDDYGHKLSETDGLGKQWRFTYDLFGNVLSATDPKAQVVNYTWGYGGQLMTRTATGNATTYTRNDLGQVKTAASPEVTYTYTYDTEQRVKTVNDNRGNKTLTYGYSAGGLLNKLAESDGRTTNFTYDPVGRLTQVWAPSNDNIVFAYDAGGRVMEKRYSNGAVASYVYNADNTLKQLINRTGATIFSRHDYTYDALGNRQTHVEKVGAADAGRTYKYVYDELSRMTGVNDVNNAPLSGLSYDILNNRTSKTEGGTTLYYNYDAANQLKEIRSGSPAGTLVTSLLYDDNGNMTSRTDGAVTSTLTYDILNQLTQVAKTGLPSEAYGYDDSGRRVRKTVGAAASYYLYHGDDILAEYASGWPTASASYTQGLGADDPFLRMAGANAQFYHQDGLGSVIATTDKTGAVPATQRFDAWGNMAAAGGSSIGQYGYTGREPDATGLMYYRARYYDPSIGRFTQRDPIGLAGGINEYGYVGGNPVNFTDPTGLVANMCEANTAEVRNISSAPRPQAYLDRPVGQGVVDLVLMGGNPALDVMGAVAWGKRILGGGAELAGAAKGVLAAPEIKLIDGFYQAEGSAFKFSKYYYEKLWSTGRGAPFLQAEEVLKTATSVTADHKAGFYRYVNEFVEMIYNPTTKEVWHLQPLGKK